ncbi:hypothetical protein PF002_g22847 [Phytophthora fragariae]|uniref:Uncharacterized protein n=1 Tax=Phytophthora fragariae TaxID=53985 RepID=A0A6A4CKQ8_9STRA|nr:hypothetical protein PF002_g22847 [Phytophthora fragariae]KAE9288264.1 hypothetical protein PF001_g20595 [Phytophthora fragariae]
MSGPRPPKRSRANTDGDFESTSTRVKAKGVMLQEPLQITSSAHENLVRWKHERIMYEEAVKNRCAETRESFASVRRPLLKSIKMRLLKSFAEFELRIPLEGMTEEKLVNAIDNISSSVINDTIPDVMEIMASNLKTDLSQNDVTARILGYFDCMGEVIEVHGLAGCLKDNVQLKCKEIVEYLRPSTLKEQVKRALECDPSLQSDLHRLFDLAKQEAIRNQQDCDTYQHMGKRDNDVVMTNKKDAMKAFLENKMRGKETSTVKRLVTSDPSEEREGIFNVFVVMPYCLNNGTTHNVIPRSIVDELPLLDSTVTLKALEPRVRGKAVGGACITCTQSVVLYIGLQTVAPRVNIRGLTFVVTETDEDEFLLRRRTLKSLGIDFDELLGLVTQGSSDVC